MSCERVRVCVCGGRGGRERGKEGGEERGEGKGEEEEGGRKEGGREGGGRRDISCTFHCVCMSRGVPYTRMRQGMSHSLTY